MKWDKGPNFPQTALRNYKKNSAKRDTRPLKGHELTHKWSLRGNPKRSFNRKNLECLKSVAAKPECGITQPISRFALYNVMSTSISSSISPSTMISLVALVGQWEKVGKSSNQASNQARF